MIELDPDTTALVLIDLQGAILGYQLAPASAEALIEKSKSLAKKFRAAGALVVLVNVSLLAEQEPRPGDEESPPANTSPGNTIDLPPGLAQPGDLLIAKRSWAAFFAADLDPELRRLGVRNVALAGARFGVESAAQQAWELGYQAVILRDATASDSPESHDTSTQHVFPRIARVTDSGAIAFSRA